MRFHFLLIGLSIVSFEIRAGALQDQLNHRWKGAWVLIKAECVSNCNAGYTNNAVHQGRTSGKARFVLDAGELAKVHKVDVKRSRIDVLLDLDVHMLVAFQDGPFQLFEDAACRVELEIDAPREVIKSRDLAAAEALISSILQRFSKRQEAMASAEWNGRRRAPFPPDYEDTLAAHARWQAEQTNLAIQAKIEEAMEEASSILSRMPNDDDYALGFGKGASMNPRLGDCQAMLDSTVHGHRKSAPRGATSNMWKDGFRDGQALTYYVALARRLSRCYVSVP